MKSNNLAAIAGPAQSPAEHYQAADSAAAPVVSIVCPTYQRPAFLRQQVENYCAQTFGGGLEMLILDDSPEPSVFLDAPFCRQHAVTYIHRPAERLTIGTKLNLLMSAAQGDIIMRFDDDDYYAPTYVERMLEFLGDADFFTLSRWFAYSYLKRKFCYWATDRMSSTHFVLSPWDPFQAVSTEGWDSSFVDGTLWGYGFSTVWRRSIYPHVEFTDMDHGEDLNFYRKVAAAGYKTTCAPDTEGLALHLVHNGNISRMFPQYVLPDFMVHKYFPIYARTAGL